MANNNQNGKLSREEAGRLGGEATAKNHDKEFYQDIGEKGGEATSKIMARTFTRKSVKKAAKPLQKP